MFDFGDDLVIDNYRIPWLIWIQILVMFLLTLTILVSYFGIFALDSSPTNGDSLTSRLEPPSTCSQRTQVAANHDTREEISTSNRTRGVENNSERDGSSVKDLACAQTSERFSHPCRFLDLAKQTFLKCLGLGSAFQKSPARDKQHED